MTNLPAEVAQVPMHGVAARTGPHPSDLGTTAAPQPSIGRYRRVPVQVHQADPDAPEVARRPIALIATRWPATPAEDVGSTAVPSLAGIARRSGPASPLRGPEAGHRGRWAG